MADFCLYLSSCKTVFTSSDDTQFAFFREVSVTPWTFPSSHLPPPQTSGTGNHCHHLPGRIKVQLEREQICHPRLCAGRPGSRLRNRLITGHLEWENTRRLGLCLCVLMQYGLEIICASRWNRPPERNIITLSPFILFSAPSYTPPSLSTSREQPP